MAKSFLRANIRFDKIRTRGLKTTYRGLSLIQKQYIKMVENKELLDESISSFWRNIQRDRHGRAAQNNNWDFYHSEEAKLTKLNTKIERFASKHNFDDTDLLSIAKLHQQHQLAHCYGGSF